MKNSEETTDHPSSRERAAVLMKAALEAIVEAGGELPLREILAEVPKRVKLTEHDRATYDKSGYVRWESILHLYSIDFVKAGYLTKNRGRWAVTPEGQASLSLPPAKMLAQAQVAYRTWRNQQQTSLFSPAPTQNGHAPVINDAAESDLAGNETAFALEEVEDKARTALQDAIWSMPPFDFQKFVAALLRGMGYYTPWEAKPGPDGGTDIIAYQDPLGTKTPHIRVQVKHRRSQKSDREEVAALRGIIRADREIGLFVSSGGFTSAAIREARSGTVHIELLDLDQCLDLWIAHYDRLDEEDKARLRLRRVYFLSPE